MRIAWFTPFTKKSAIGRFSQAVTRELAKEIQVDLWLADRNDPLVTALPTFDYDPRQPLKEWWPRDAYDFAICNLGNYLDYHRELFEFSRKVPSVIVLHDYVMHHFFAGFAESVLRDMNSHCRRLEELYGDAAREANALARAGKAPCIWNSDRVAEFPMFEDTLRGALGAVVHSDYLRAKVAPVFPGPLKKIHLAYEPHSELPVLSRKELNLPEDRLIALTVGHVNTNKRIARVIECLANNPDLASRIYYRVCGHIEPSYRRELETLIQRSRLSATVNLSGQASDIDVRSCFHWADLCINLRYPAMEGASASLAESMLYGKAAIVTDTGVYSEIPDNCVLKVRPDRESEDLASALRRLMDSADLREQIGVAALEFARENFTPAKYAEQLLAFLIEVQGTKPVLSLLNRTSRILAEIGVQPGMEIVGTVAEMSKELFCGDASQAPWNKPSRSADETVPCDQKA